jgi:hypothetical protein
VWSAQTAKMIVEYVKSAGDCSSFEAKFNHHCLRVLGQSEKSDLLSEAISHPLSVDRL